MTKSRKLYWMFVHVSFVSYLCLEWFCSCDWSFHVRGDLKCVFPYGRVWSSWDDPVWFTGRPWASWQGGPGWVQWGLVTVVWISCPWGNLHVSLALLYLSGLSLQSLKSCLSSLLSWLLSHLSSMLSCLSPLLACFCPICHPSCPVYCPVCHPSCPICHPCCPVFVLFVILLVLFIVLFVVPFVIPVVLFSTDDEHCLRLVLVKWC